MRADEVMAELCKPLARELLGSSPPVRLAYVATDGTPRVVPVGFLWTGEVVVVCTAAIAAKVRSLRANPAVALTLDTQSPPWRALLVRGVATVEVVEGVPDEYLAAARKGTDGEAMAAFEAAVRGLYPEMAKITITPTWAKLLDFETTMPSAVEELLRRQDQGAN